MKIGFPNNPRKNIYKELEWIGINGFDFVDLFLEKDEAVPEKINSNKLRAILDKHNLNAIGHTAYYLPIGSSVKILRDLTIKETERYFKVFQELGIKFVTIHANWPIDLFTGQEGINFQAHTLRQLIKKARKYNLVLMYEPIDTDKDTLENISKVLDKVPSLFLHLDIGHCNLSNRSPADFIEKFNKKIKHIHVHDNDGTTDQHLPIGKGNINWEETIRVLKKYYDGTITLEVFVDDKKEVLESKNILKKLWAEA